MAAPGAHPAGPGFWRRAGNAITAPFRGAWNYRENVGVALGVVALGIGGVYLYNKAKDGIEGYRDRDNPLIVYDTFSFKEKYQGGDLFVKKVNGVFEVKYTEGGRVMEVNDSDGDREVDAQWYTPKRGQRTSINRGSARPEIADIVTRGDEIFDAAYQEAMAKGNLETVST